MANYYCKHCGISFRSVSTLTSGSCSRHPAGAYNGNHVLYQGTKKAEYTCKYCGVKNSRLTVLTSSSCLRHPKGSYEGKHEAAL